MICSFLFIKTVIVNLSVSLYISMRRQLQYFVFTRGAIDAARDKGNLQFGQIQETLMLIHKHYGYSPTASRDLKTVTEAVGEKTMRPTNLKIMAIIRKNHYMHFVK